MPSTPTWWRPVALAAGLGLVATLLLGCPRRDPRAPSTAASGPKELWSTQIEGDPWPWRVAKGNLLVWRYRLARAGFLFPIKLESYGAATGRANWSVPIRPWLWSTQVPWSVNVALFETTIAAWVKGNVARSLRLDTGEEAWSIPLCRGLARAGDHLVMVSESRLLVLEPTTGKTMREIPLASPLVTPPVVRGRQVVGLTADGHLVSVSLDSGRSLWRRRVDIHLGAQPDRPVLAGSIILLPLLPSSTAADKKATLEARSLSTGALLWRQKVPRSGGSSSPLAGMTVAGDVLLVLQRASGCLLVHDLASGRLRFRRCGLNLASAPLRHGKWLYVLGTDRGSVAALRRGDVWSTIDFPLLALHARTGRARAVRRPGRRRGASRFLRATRLQIGPLDQRLLYLLQRDRFLSALRLRKLQGSR